MYREIGKYIIRDWQMEDAPSIAKYANNRKIWMNLRDAFPHPYSLQDAESFISRAIEANPKTVFAIATQSEAIGSIGLMLGKDVHRYTAEMGYWLAEPFWGKGIMTLSRLQQGYSKRRASHVRVYFARMFLKMVKYLTSSFTVMLGNRAHNLFAWERGAAVII
jgi:hypothetical protein